MECGTCYCLMIVALGKLRKDDIKTELCIVVHSITNIELDTDLHFCENRIYIQRLKPLGSHTIEVAHDPDLTIPGAYN